MSSTPEDRVDRLLAAPEEVVENPTERRKLIERKARDDARKARQSALKSAISPTQEDILTDLVRVAESEVTNPHWHEWRILSRRRYELYGHYAIEHVTRICGLFEHAKQQAGLATPVGERQFARARTQASLCEHDERYMRRYLLPHVGKFPELMEPGGWRSGVAISDMHGLYLDPFTWEVFVATCEDLEPDVVYLNGDVLDGNEISTHPKIPGAGTPLQLEFDFVRGLFRELRERLPPGTRIVWGAGNHFLDRMVRYLTQIARGVAGLNSLRIDQLLELEELEIELVQGGTFVSPKGTENDEPRRILWDCYMVTHGTRLGQYPAAAELRQWGMSGTSGHVHRAAVHFGATYSHRGLSWMSTPMGCIEDAGRHYIKDFAGWQKGFGVFFSSPNGRIHHYPVITDDGVALVEGRGYKIQPDVPQKDPQVKKLWLDRFGLDPLEYV